MTASLPLSVRHQLDDLALDFGTPLVQIVPVNNAAFWDRTTVNRTQEVCMVVRRPSGRLLTMRKTFYPPGVYRLMTGGVEPGEGVLAALRREVHEETGLHVQVRRLLAVTGYRAEDKAESEPRFWTFAFLLDEAGGTLGALDPEEQVADFREADRADLPAIAAALDTLADQYSEDLGQRWAPWGRFRAVIHRAVYEALSPG